METFSLIFIEFKSEGFLFHTTWQWEVGTWQECDEDDLDEGAGELQG